MSSATPSNPYDFIAEAILSGELPPGAKLNEPALAERMGISRAPVREAIRRLQERGIVVHSPHQGARVVSHSLADYLALIDVREALETMACRLAATVMTDRELASLARLMDLHHRQFDADPAGPYIQSDLDGDFHVCIARGSGNPLLTGLLCEQLYPRLKLCRLQHKGLAGRGKQAWIEHQRIVDALEQRDAELAEMMMRRHIVAARRAVIAMAQGGKIEGQS